MSQYAASRHEGFWDYDNARFTDVALPYISAVPLFTISLISVSRLIPSRVANSFGPWRPKWTTSFIQEELSDDDAGTLPKDAKNPLLWPIALAIISVIALAVQIAKLLTISGLQVHTILLVVSWTLASVVVALSRPRYAIPSLLTFYIPALVAELAASKSWSSQPDLQSLGPHLSAVLAVVSIAIILLMPLRPRSPYSGPISAVQSTPHNTERSPEDALRLWQFLTVSWVWPLLSIGKARQMQNEDVWLMGYDFQTRRIAQAFREIRGSTVLRRLLRANGIDCCVLILISFIQLFCEFASPLLLHQLLLVMESPHRRNQPALTYALLMLLRGVISAQAASLSLWYSRRCFERSRAELIMMIFDKTMSRKVIVSPEKKEGETTDGTANGSDSKPNENGTSNGTAASGNTGETATSKKAEKKKEGKLALQLKLFKEAFWRSSKTDTKAKGPASTGLILNLVRTDADEIAQRFRELERLVKLPFGIIFAIWLIWALLGPTCFVAVFCIFIAQILNALVTRIQVRWRRNFSKKSTDARVQINSQYIDVIRHLRWYAWQETWLAKVMAARRHELNIRIVSMCLNLTSYFINVLAGGLFPVAAFWAFTVLGGHQLRIDLIFPALQLFGNLQSRLREIPSLLTTFLNAYVAMDRIEDFMNEPEKEAQTEPEPDTTPAAVSATLRLSDCTFAWPGTDVVALQEVSLVIEPGLTVVYGKIGSGKTALLKGLLGEMDLQCGHSEVPNTMIGYCSQTPWLQSMSIRDNILFFAPYDEQRYEKVLECCALSEDLTNFRDGDQSHIGENGIGLSGGQKARVALARAIYSRSQTLLLDDPLSALDHQTAETIVQKAFSWLSEDNRTVVLVTHRTSLVRKTADLFVGITEDGVTTSKEDPFSSKEGSPEREDKASPEVVEKKPTDAKEGGNSGSPQQFIEQEHRETGAVKAKVWLTFVRAGKYWWIFLFAMMILVRIFNFFQQWFFKSWGEAYAEKSTNARFLFQAGIQLHDEWTSFRESESIGTLMSLDPIDYLPSPNDNLRPWLIVLLLVTIGQSLALLLYAISQLTAVFSTSKVMFAQAMIRITNATFRFYDVTPVGRLMNRLTSDIQVLDSALSYFGATIFYATLFISSVVIIASISPLFLLFSIILMAIFVVVFLQFLPASQSMKRLETVSISPLYTIFGELLQDQGLTSVRAFHAQEHFQSRVITTVDQFQGIGHFYWSVQNWLMYRYENISALSTFAMTAIALATSLPPGLTAFMLNNASSFIMSTHTLCLRFGDLQTEFISVERIVELLEIEQEPEGTIDPPATWPKFGSEVTFEKVTIRYAPNLDPSLTNINLHIPGGSTTAIIGRTGSGKSTLAAALLNIVRAETGVITIDGVPLTDIKVKTLRHRVTFVPQDPVLFLGSIRQNLDPVDQFSDEECEAVLKRVCDGSAGQNWGLDTQVESGGRNFSQGQRQLIGITRAVLRRSGIVILDEATASIDVETSMKLQTILREELKEATIITIAHRVEAVKGVDYFVQLDNGKVAREGPVEGNLLIDQTDGNVLGRSNDEE
ncbi:ABC transporter [Tothia fuscella]|uniref:ABC transporter n=1 Tax=Tothia fuscella TaxID=1048955 RepID=A0A9P4NRV5_9PEZI|nr:ABC transporter [Tothia fuscella]